LGSEVPNRKPSGPASRAPSRRQCREALDYSPAGSILFSVSGAGSRLPTAAESKEGKKRRLTAVSQLQAKLGYSAAGSALGLGYGYGSTGG
jgi:hypothetical protein